MMSEEELRANIKESLAYSARVYGLLPRPISWGEVQKGDTISAEVDNGPVRVVCGHILAPRTVGKSLGISASSRTYWIYECDGWSLTLIDRPEPERPAGSLWYHPGMDAGFVRTDAKSPRFEHYFGFTRGRWGYPIRGIDIILIAELIPWAERPDAAGDPR